MAKILIFNQMDTTMANLFRNLMMLNFSVCFVLYTTLTTIAGYQYPKGILPCKFYETFKLDCSNRQLTDIPHLSQNISDLDLSYNQLWRFIPSNTNRKISMNLEKSTSAFPGQKNLIRLDLSRNKLRNISDSPFATLSSLQILVLQGSDIEFFSPSTFKGLYNLINLDLSKNKFSILPTGIFSSLTKLKSLNIKSYYLIEIPSQVMTPLHALTYLHLNINHFTPHILGKGFESLTNLSSLHLFMSDFNTRGILMDNKTFQHLQEIPITSFDLAIHYNVYVTLQSGIFDPFKNLVSFKFDSKFDISKLKVDSLGTNLSEISLKLLPPNNKLTAHSLMLINKYSATLRSLNLIESHIDKIEGATFIEFSKLQRLTINKAILTNLDQRAFSGLYHLEELCLANNRFTSFPGLALSEISIRKSLRVLDLSHNKLTSANTHYPLPASLRDLILDFNPLSSIKESLCEFQNITNLSLARLKHFPLKFCQKIPKLLTKLDLSWPINRDILNYDVFFTKLSQDTPHLKILNISGCLMTNVNMVHMQNLTALEHLVATNSYTFTFDFSTKWGHFIQFPKLKILNLASNRLPSITEMDLSRTIPLIQSLDLSMNRIQDVDDDTFKSLTKLKYLNLAYNLFHRVNALVHMKSIVELDISFNFVNEVPKTFLQTIKASSLTTLDLSGNPYSCTCALQPFKKWILSDRHVFLKPKLMYKCAGPSKMDGLSITEINLDCKSKLPIYVGVSACCGFLLCLTIVLVFHFRWHIRYKLFLLFKRRRHRRQVQEDGIELNRLGYHAFVSYAHESDRDLNWVLDELRVNMEEGPDPITLCIGQARDYIPGANLIEATTDAIHNSRKAIIVLSPNYVASEWCYFEVQQAWLRLLNEGQDVVVMVLLDPIPDNKMTMWLRQFLCKKGYLRWPGDRAGQNLFWQYLREKIKQPTAVDRRYDA